MLHVHYMWQGQKVLAVVPEEEQILPVEVEDANVHRRMLLDRVRSLNNGHRYQCK